MVGGAGQALVASSEEVAIVEAVQHAAQDVELFRQHRVRLGSIHRGAATALAGGVFLEGRLQLVGNPDVVHHQTALLVLEDAIHPGDGLHQVVALHRLVDVERMDTGRIEAGQPHVAHDDDLQWVCRVLEALFQALLDLAAVDMGPQQGLVAGRAGHHDLDGALFRVGVVPLRAELDDFVVEVDADVAAHGDDHRLAGLRLAAFLVVGHQVGGYRGNPRLGADYLLQRRPAALQPGLLAFLFILGEFIDLGIDLGKLVGLEREPGQARLEVDGHRGAVFLGLLHVVDVDVVAEHGAGVAVLAGHRGTGEGDEGRIGQRVAQVLGIADLIHDLRLGRLQPAGVVGWILPGFRGRPQNPADFQFRVEAILRAVRLVGDDDDVAAFRQHGKNILILAGHELLDGGKDDAAGRPVAQFCAQILPRFRLYRLLAQQILRQ